MTIQSPTKCEVQTMIHLLLTKRKVPFEIFEKRLKLFMGKEVWIVWICLRSIVNLRMAEWVFRTNKEVENRHFGQKNHGFCFLGPQMIILIKCLPQGESINLERYCNTPKNWGEWFMTKWEGSNFWNHSYGMFWTTQHFPPTWHHQTITCTPP